MDKHTEYLWKQYLTGKSSPEELEEFLLLNNDPTLVEKLLNEHQEDREMAPERQEALLKTVLGKGRVIRLRWLYWSAAASLVLIITGSLLLRTTKTINNKINIAAGKTGAILTLSDGSEVVLDSLGNTVIADPQSAKITLQSGSLLYDNQTGNSTVHNTMSTLRGRQFHLKLSDGTSVWLNSESSIRYPVRFDGKERRVSVNGEAYFEVAKNAGQPFRVEVNGTDLIEVLGTAFNVNAYHDEESVNTTLINGSVRINKSLVLVPGQQARFTQGGLQTSNVDIEKVTAWKNGGFDFENVTLPEAMRQLERWYDIKVVIEPGVPGDAPFYGQISRDISLQNLLKLFEKSNLQFRLEGERTLIVSK